MKIFLDTVGCRLNQSEIESFARQFAAGGHTLVASPQTADLTIINTCTVTARAASDSRQKIRQAAHAGGSQVIVTGCWATMEPELAAALPGVQEVVLNVDKDSLVKNINQGTNISSGLRQVVPGKRKRTRAFIKAQDGCDNSCTFCITARARGAGRSCPIDQVMEDIDAATNSGVFEVVLTGVHLGSWGHDFVPSQSLYHLVKAVLTQSSATRVRLSSLEPWDINEDFFQLWENPRLCRHLHLPLQSGCKQTLRRMVRRTTPHAYSQLLAAARRAIPDIAITTDIMVGFPGENEAEFEESLNFVQEMTFAGGHVFSYSPRPSTPAAVMDNQVPERLRKQRSTTMCAVLTESASRYRHSFSGQMMDVLWERVEPLEDCPGREKSWRMSGLTDNYLRVTAISKESRSNRLDHVRLTTITTTGLNGNIQIEPQITEVTKLSACTM